MKTIWFFHHYASSPNKGALVRPYDFCKVLQKKGYNTNIFSSAFNHFTHENRIPGKEKYIESIEEGVPFVFVKTSEYTSNGFSRVKNMLSFFFRLFFVTNKIANKPDIIIASCPHPFVGIAGILIAKRYKIPCVLEVRDLWPESIVAYSNSITKKNVIIKMLYGLEKWLYKKADKIIFTIQGGYDYIIDKGWNESIPKSKVFYINNGLDLKKFDDNIKAHFFTDEHLDNKKLFKVVYAGSIRKVNNLELIIDAATLCSNKNIVFLIWGGGSELEYLQERIKKENITNVIFKGRVEKKYIPYILSKADINILHYISSYIWKYGGSQNKVFEYLAAQKPVLSTIKMGYDVINENTAGVCIESQTALALSEAVERLALLNKTQYIKMAKNARKVSANYDFEILTKKLINVIEGDK